MGVREDGPVLDLPSLPQFAGVEALLQGRPAARREFDWEGHLRATEPIVAVSFVSTPEGVEWCKSERGRERLDARLYLAWYDATGRHVRVHWGVGNSQRVARTVLEEPATSALALAPDCMRIESGSLRRIFVLKATPEVDCWALLVPSRFVGVGRNGLWSLRPKWREGVPAPWLGILTHDRTGRIETAGSPP
jgi:hypothetical protein